jgi:hypothetical protein
MENLTNHCPHQTQLQSQQFFLELSSLPSSFPPCVSLEYFIRMIPSRKFYSTVPEFHSMTHTILICSLVGSHVALWIVCYMLIRTLFFQSTYPLLKLLLVHNKSVYLFCSLVQETMKSKCCILSQTLSHLLLLHFTSNIFS